MRRRSFLAAIAAAFVAPDPEKLLWQPGKKLISIPAPRKVVPLHPSRVIYSRFVVDVTTHSSRHPWANFVEVQLIDSGKNAMLPLPNGGSIVFPTQSPAPAIRSRPR